MKKVIDRDKRSTTLNEGKPVKNKRIHRDKSSAQGSLSIT